MPDRPLTSTSKTSQSDAVRRDLRSRFNVAIGLMAVIPLLTFGYLITVRCVSISALGGLNGVYVLLAIFIALLGVLTGHQLIRDVIRRLVDVNAQLAQLNDRQAAFVGNVAHELRSPLAVFKGALDNLADDVHGPLTSDQRQPVTMCQREVNRLARLVGDLLDVTRIEAGRLPLHNEPVVLQDVVEAVRQLFDGVAKERQIRLETHVPDHPVTVVGDRDRLQQVLVNLVANALKFTARGTVGLSLSEEGTAARIEVSDTGPGISAPDQQRIFDKFERVGGQREEGSGLGLPIARDLVELHHGHMAVESRVGQGSRFIVWLPNGAA